MYEEYFERKKKELGFERSDQLAAAQEWLDQRYPGLARAKQIHQGVLRVVLTSSSAAADLRLRQTEFVKDNQLEGIRLAITVGSLS